MKIGLFGGSFDPIHVAHVALAVTFREQMSLDEVWFLVTPQNPWKQGSTLSPDSDRLRMVQLAIEGVEGLVASDFEFHLEKPTYSYVTLSHLRQAYPEHTFTLLVGGDNWAMFDHWAHYDEILRQHPVAVYPREGCRIETPPAIASIPHTLSILQAPELPMSSTMVRHCVAEGASIEDMVHPAVRQYIVDRQLYE